jgi:S-formylglutathione hydrolase
LINFYLTYKTNKLKIVALLSALLLVSTTITFSQNGAALRGSIQRIKVHGKGLEGNLEGDSADRYVSVYLPPSYTLQPNRRYPVIYFLHGFTDTDAKYFGLAKHWMNLPPLLDSAFVSGAAGEMILVMPNAFTRYQGSWYSNSITTGNWEDFVAKELVSFIDKNYRTIPKPASRGLAGHSMGGYGALRIGEKYPDIFSSIYLLSPATLMQDISDAASYSKLDRIKTFADF